MFYFVIGIFFCAFYLMNLVLAMVYLSYEEELSSVEKEVLLRDKTHKSVTFNSELECC